MKNEAHPLTPDEKLVLQGYRAADEQSKIALQAIAWELIKLSQGEEPREPGEPAAVVSFSDHEKQRTPGAF